MTSVPLHGLLILKSKSDNLMTSVNDFIANSFHCNIQSFACLTISICFIVLQFLFLPKSIQLSKTSSSPIFCNKQPTWIGRYRLNILNLQPTWRVYGGCDNDCIHWFSIYQTTAQQNYGLCNGTLRAPDTWHFSRRAAKYFLLSCRQRVNNFILTTTEFLTI